MPEKVVPGPVCDDRSIREAVCIHTKKIFDSCRDKDCVEDLRVYPTRCSQEVIDRAQSIKAGTAELLYAYIDVEPVTFNRGFYTVDVRYFYRITADAFVGAARPVQVCGLAVFSKRAVLFGSESGSKSFSSARGEEQIQCVPQSNLPTAVVEAVIYTKLPIGTKIKRNPLYNQERRPKLGPVFFILCPAGYQSDAIPTGASVQALPARRRGIAWSRPTLFPALCPATDNRPAASRGGPPGHGQLEVPLSKQYARKLDSIKKYIKFPGLLLLVCQE